MAGIPSLRLVYMGTAAFAVPSLRALATGPHEVIAVYTQPARPAGRGLKARASPVHRAASDLGLMVHTPASLKDPAEQEVLAGLRADLAVVAAYGLLLPKSILETPGLGCINLHASLLPRWRGAAPIQRALLAGDAETGVTIFQMEPTLDTGPVLATESAHRILQRLLHRGAFALPLPASKRAAVVFERQLVARHGEPSRAPSGR